MHLWLFWELEESWTSRLWILAVVSGSSQPSGSDGDTSAEVCGAVLPPSSASSSNWINAETGGYITMPTRDIFLSAHLFPSPHPIFSHALSFALPLPLTDTHSLPLHLTSTNMLQKHIFSLNVPVKTFCCFFHLTSVTVSTHTVHLQPTPAYMLPVSNTINISVLTIFTPPLSLDMIKRKNIGVSLQIIIWLMWKIRNKSFYLVKFEQCYVIHALIKLNLHDFFS